MQIQRSSQIELCSTFNYWTTPPWISHVYCQWHKYSMWSTEPSWICSPIHNTISARSLCSKMDMQERCMIILEQVNRIRLQLKTMQLPGKPIETYPMKGEDRSRLMALEVGRQPKLGMLRNQMPQSERRWKRWDLCVQTAYAHPGYKYCWNKQITLTYPGKQSKTSFSFQSLKFIRINQAASMKYQDSEQIATWMAPTESINHLLLGIAACAILHSTELNTVNSV